VTEGDVDHSVVWLQGEGYARVTTGRLLKRCRQFFRWALRKKLVKVNPFADVKAPAQANESRKFFVTVEATELAETYPVRVVCKWIGNTERIAAKHYLQVTDDHFERAAGGDAKGAPPALQNPTLPVAVWEC
jgi:hypothetical protein